MAKQVTVGEFTLEASGDQIVVRDATGGIVETVSIDDLNGELMLPSGQWIDVADLLAGADIANLQTAAGGQPGAESGPASPNGGSANFTAFQGSTGAYAARGSAGALGSTSLNYSTPGNGGAQRYNTEQAQIENKQAPEVQPILVSWADHDPWQIEENQRGGVFGTVINGNPADFTFEVSDSRFEVLDGVLRVRNGYAFDFENEPGIDLQITATSRTGDVKTANAHIDVTDLNEEQTSITLDNASVDENTAGAVIGNLTVADPDAGDTQSFKVSDNRFEVVNGQLKLKDGVALDHEGEDAVSVTVTATDKGGNQISETFSIEVGNLNEAPVDIDLSNDTLVENVAGAVVGTLTTVDPDAGDSHTYAVSDDRFEVVNGQLKLKDGVALDFEAEPTLSVVVTATDAGGKSVQETFTLSVGGSNEAQTALTLDNDTISENDKGAVVGTLTVADPDAGDKQSFAVSDDRFQVVDGELRLKGGVALDHESEPTVSVTVTATDKGGNQISESFKITVSDVNEAQTAMSLTGSTVAENAAGAVIGDLSVTDPDAGDSQSFEVSDSRFEVVNGQLKLKDGVSLNYEAGSSVDVTVTATDMGGHQIAKTITVGVSDVNEQQTSISLFGTSIAENTATTASKTAVIGSVLVTDPDANDSQTFTVSDNRFQVVNNQLVLKPGFSLDYETEPTVNLTITATDKGGNQISTAATINVTNVNEAQTGMTLSASKVAENVTGVVIGTLTTADPDDGDKQSYTVSDNRFEVVNNQLKLKSGVSINYESEPSINVTVTAKDTGNHSYSKTFTIGVTDVNEAQTGMSLSATKVAENSKGATIGTLTTTDPDANDSQTYIVSDNRFEVVNSQLKLKSGVSLDYEAGSSVNVTVTATDKGQNQYSKTFSVQVTDVNEAAPVVIAKDGSIVSHVVDTNSNYDPTGSKAVGNYLYNHDNAAGNVPTKEITGIDSANLTLGMETEVQVTFQKEAAGHRNMIGTYQYDDAGQVIPGSVKFVWLDASATTEGQIGATMVKDFLGYAQSNTVSLGTMEAGTHVGFFTIADGADVSANRTLIANAASGAGSQAAAMNAIASQLSIQVDGNGNGHVYVGNSQLSGDVFFSHDKTMNTDFNGSSDIHHMTSGVTPQLPGQLIIGVEDMNGGGDKDYNDVVFSVNLGTYNTNKMCQETVQPSVDFSDADSSTLTQAMIQTSGFQSGDMLNIPSSNLFDVQVVHNTAEYTITITGKTGGETLDQYESFVNSIYFSTSSKVEGDRHIDYSVTDNGGLKSNVATADITVDTDYRLSTSELGTGKTTLDDGSDTLYINTDKFGPVDMGEGYDTVHLAQHNRGFDHNDAVKLSGVEAIDTTGYGINKVSLNITDVLNMTDDDNQLTVIGDKGDVVTLESSGKGHWEVAGQDAEFTTYHYTDSSHEAIVQISNQLTAQIA